MNFLIGDGVAMIVEGCAAMDTEGVHGDSKHSARANHLRAFFMSGVYELCKISIWETASNAVNEFPCIAKLNFAKMELFNQIDSIAFGRKP